VHQGLVGLGWSAREADKALDEVAPASDTEPDVGALLRAALQTLRKA
jgi:holliday junction DNA helicase RuvA